MRGPAAQVTIYLVTIELCASDGLVSIDLCASDDLVTIELTAGPTRGCF